MNSWKVILATLVIFGAGVVTGALLNRQSTRARTQPAQAVVHPPRPGTPNPAGFRLDFLRRAQNELNLSPEQRQQVERVLTESQERTKALMEPVFPLIREEVQRTKEEFKEVLDPDQRRAFDEIMQKHQRQRDASKERRPARERDAQPAR